MKYGGARVAIGIPSDLSRSNGRERGDGDAKKPENCRQGNDAGTRPGFMRPDARAMPDI